MSDSDQRMFGPCRALSLLPLLVAYVLLPLTGERVGMAGRAVDPRLGAWAVLAGAGLLWAVWSRLRARKDYSDPLAGRSRGLLPPVLAALSALLLAGAWSLAAPHAGQVQAALRWLAECAPLVYLLLALLWASRFGLPGRAGFLRLGGALGALALADAGLALLAGTPDTAQWMRAGPLLRTGAEPVACLLAVSLFAAMREDHEPAQELHPGRFDLWLGRLCMALVVLGMAATLSRTALFAAACCWLFLGRGGRLRRLLLAVLLLGAGALSMHVSTPLAADTVQLRGGLLWLAGMERFTATPEALLTARGLGPFALSLPPSLSLSIGLPGKVHLLQPQEITSLWLRLALVWSGFGALAFGLLLLVPTVLRPSRLGVGIIALCLAQGMVFGLFYDPGAAVVLWLALLAGLARAPDTGPEREISSADGETALWSGDREGTKPKERK